MGDVVVGAHHPTVRRDHQVTDGAVVGAREGERPRLGCLGEGSADHAAVSEDRDVSSGWRAASSHQRARTRPAKPSGRLGAWDHIPALLGASAAGPGDGLRRPGSGTTPLPFAEVDLPNPGSTAGTQTEPASPAAPPSRPCGAGGDVDGRDGLGREPVGHPLRLRRPIGAERGIALAVHQRERRVGSGRCRFAVADQEDAGRARGAARNGTAELHGLPLAGLTRGSCYGARPDG